MRGVTALIVVIVIAVVAGTVPASAAEDTTDPRVEWSSPFESGSQPDDEEALTVDDGTVRLNASIYDASAIDRVEIERVYSDGKTDDRDFRQLAGSKDALHNVTVHAGTFDDTEINIRVFDEHGFADITEFEVQVSDTEAPTADLKTERTDDGEIRLTGTVHDDTQPKSMTVVLLNHNNPVVNSRATNDERQTLGGVDISRNEFAVDVTLPDPGGDSVTVRLEDRAENQREIEVPLSSTETETATPTPTSTPAATPDATPTPTVTPVPTVSTPAPTPVPTAAPSTDTQTPAPTSTPSSSGGAGPLTIVFRFLIIGIGLFAVGGWLSLQ